MAFLKRSPWVIHYDASSCNGCDIEVLACLTPVYDVERLGIINTGNPKHADIFLITGSVNEQNREVVRNLFDQMPAPKVVVAIGICAATGGIFSECYNVAGGVNWVIPVDVFVPGCAARPEHIIDGISMALGILEKRQEKLSAMASGIAPLSIEHATTRDAEEILALQKTVYKSEAELYNDFTFTPLKQTLDEMIAEFSNTVFLKAVIAGEIVASVRASLEGDSCLAKRLIINNSYHDFGIGKKLMAAIEKEFKGKAARYEVFCGHRSIRRIHFYKGIGYEIFKSAKVNEHRDRVYLQKSASKESL